MLARAFLYDFNEKKWYESHDETVVQEDIQTLPTGLVWQTFNENVWLWDGAISWWDDDAKTVKEIDEIRGVDCFLVADGKERKFLSGYFEVNEAKANQYTADNLGYLYHVPFRWYISQVNHSAPLLLRLDFMAVQGKQKDFSDGIMKAYWKAYTFTAIAATRRMVSSPYSFFFSEASSGKNDIQEAAPQGRVDDIPEQVAKTVLDALQESYAEAWGIKPAIPSGLKPDKGLIIAYIERPFDTNIVYLHRYLGSKFVYLIPRENRNPYRLFMEVLHLNPPSSLHKAYQNNPYAVTIWLILQRAGFTDINVMRQFFSLTNFLGWELHDFYLDDRLGYVRSMDKEKELQVHDGLEVCRWLVEERGEPSAARIICDTFLRIGVRDVWEGITHGEQMQHDTFRYMLRSERVLLDDETRKAFLHHGLTKEVHDMCVRDMERVRQKELYPNRPINYTPEVLDWCTHIDNLDFALPDHTDDLIDLGRSFHNCVATYRDKALTGSSIIVYAKLQDTYAICIEVVGKHIRQALGPCNQPLDEEMMKALRHWAEKCHISS